MADPAQSPMTPRIPLLLLPGLLCDAELWADQVAGLSDVAAPRVADLTRHGTIGALAADAVEQAGAPRFALAGLSMGGYVAFEILRRVPERVVALALVATSARPDAPEQTALRRRLMRLAEHDFGAVVESLLPKLVHPAHAADPRIVRVVRGMAARVGADAFQRQQRAIIGRPDSRPDLATIRCPTAVIAGRDDALMAPEIHEEMAARVPGAQRVRIDGCGHLASIEKPAEVTIALRGLLRRVAPVRN